MRHGDRKSYRAGLILAVIVAILFSFYPAGLKHAYEDGANVVYAALCLVFARSFGLAFHCLIRKKKLFATKEATRQGLTGGFFQAISSGMTTLAVHYLEGPLVVVILFTNPLMLHFYMIAIREAKFSLRTVLLTLAALAGLSFVLDIWHGQDKASLLGMMMAFTAAAAIVPRLYIYGTQTRERDPAVVGAENFLSAALFTLPIMLIEWPHPAASLEGNLWMFLGVATLATGTFYSFYGIAALGSFSWAISQKLQPVFTALVSALLVHEVLKPGQYGGMAVVLLSLGFYQYTEYRRKQPVPEPLPE